MKKIIQLILFSVMFCMYSYGQADKVSQAIFKLKEKNEHFHSLNLFHSPVKATSKGNGSYIKYIMDKNELERVFNANYQSIKLSLPLPGGAEMSLLLTQHRILTDDFKLTITDEKGLHEIERTPGLYYIGIIEGRKSRTMVACSVFNNELACVISDETGNWNLGPLKGIKNNLPGKENEYAYYNDKTFHLPLKFTCGANERATIEMMKEADLAQNNSAVPKCIKIFFDCAFDLYVEAGNNATAVSSYVASLFNVVATLYFNENINVSIQSIHVWSIPDPFDYTDKDHAWQSFKNYYLSNGYTGDIAQLLSTQTDGGTAFLASACAIPTIGVFSFSGAMTYSFGAFPTYSWDAMVVTHEDGHVLGSNHTQWCGWAGGAIDNCYATEGGCPPGPAPTNGGTIMSYCHLASYGINFANGFGPLPGNAIRNYVASASCFTSCICPSVTSVSVPITSGNSFYSASGIVYGYSIVGSGAVLTFSAGNNVTLKPGFFAQAGCNFKAQIAPCTLFSTPLLSNSSGIKSIPGSIESFDKNSQVNIIPNPFTSSFVLSINSQHNIKAQVTIYTALGVKVKEQKGINLAKGLNQIIFDCSYFSAGVYIVEINFGNIKSVKKIVKI